MSEAVRESHVARMPALASRFVTVPNGIAPLPPGRDREATRRDLGLAAGDVAFLTVGSLTPQKAQHVLLEAFARVAGAEPAARNGNSRRSAVTGLSSLFATFSG